MKCFKKILVLLVSLALFIPCITMTSFADENDAMAFIITDSETTNIQAVTVDQMKSTTATVVTDSNYWGYSSEKYTGTFYSLDGVMNLFDINMNSKHGLMFIDTDTNPVAYSVESSYHFYVFDQSEVLKKGTALGAAGTYGLAIKRDGYTSITIIKDLYAAVYFDGHSYDHSSTDFFDTHNCIFCKQEEHYIELPNTYYPNRYKIYDCMYTLDSWYQSDNGYWYYINPDGSVYRGWLLRGNTWYYMDPDTGRMQTGPRVINGVPYLFKDSGAMAANGWVKYYDYWYYATSSGRLHTGWLYSGGKWYYMDPVWDGRMTTGFYHDYSNDKWYYMNSSGAMVYGWVWDDVNSCWYYMGSSGAAVTGWHVIGGKWYFFLPNTRMAQNEWYGGYWLNADGTWTYPYRGSWHADSYGIWFGDTSGWYARNTKMRIDDYYYTFDGNGYRRY